MKIHTPLSMTIQDIILYKLNENITTKENYSSFEIDKLHYHVLTKRVFREIMMNSSID